MYDIIFLVLFTTFVIWFLYTRRKNLQREGILFLYRTKFGMKAIEWTSRKFKKQLQWIQYVSIFTGYVLMATMMYLFFQLVYIYVSSPETVKAIKIPPIMPLIPYLPSLFSISFLPPFYFTYWIVILAIVAISHEFSHGIFARLHNIKIKSTGFGFLGPFLAAFVEPDEKQMGKKSIKSQLAVLSAGTFANIIVSILFIIIFVLFFWSMFIPSGAVFDMYAFSDINLTQVNSVNGYLVNNPSPQTIMENLNLKSGNNLTEIKISNSSYLIDNNIFIANIKSVGEIARVYDDLPTARAGITGAIIELNGVKISSINDLKIEIGKYLPGANITVKTEMNNNQINNYNITLADNGNGKAVMGIVLLPYPSTGIKGVIYQAISIVKEPGTYYKSRLNTNFNQFIVDLLWWMILINLSVALVNMLPLGIFDGGRVFYLTILYFTKSDNMAKKIFKWMTMLLLFMLALIMVFWAYSVYFS